MVEFFHFFKKSKFCDTNAMCCIKLFTRTFGVMAKVQSKYNVIIFKSKTFIELKGWFHVDCDFILQIPLISYIILVWSTLLKHMENYHLGQYFGALNHVFTDLMNISSGCGLQWNFSGCL
jgi:hypothetical protein